MLLERCDMLPTCMIPGTLRPMARMLAVHIAAALAATAMLIDAGPAAASTWSPGPPTGLANVEDVSCATSWFCVSVGDGGRAAVFDGSSWHVAQPIPDGSSITSVSCPTTTFCVATDSNAHAVVFNGKAWAAPKTVFAYPDELSAVSCVSASFCAAVNYMGSGVTFNGSTWSEPVTANPGLTRGLDSISCAAGPRCVAVGDAIVTSYQSGSWGPASSLGDRVLTSVSCSAPNACVAVTSIGEAYTFDGANWSGGGRVAGAYGLLTSVSCAAPNFCAAVASGGPLTIGGGLLFDGASWTLPAPLDSAESGSVSCPSPTFCMIVTSLGNAFTYGTLEPPPPGNPQVPATTPTPTTNEIRTALRGEIASIARTVEEQLRGRRSSFITRVVAPTVGTLTVRIRGAGPLLAIGHGRASAGVATSVRIRLTRKGSAVLARAARKRANVPATINITLRPASNGAPAVVVGDTLTLRPRARPHLVQKTAVAAQANPCPDQDLSISTGDLERLRQALLCVTNYERGANGLPPLLRDAQLDAVAQAHSDDMNRRDYFDHVNPEGQGPQDRARAGGFNTGVSEVLALTTTARSAVDLWLASQPHCRILMSTHDGVVGIGLAGDRVTMDLSGTIGFGTAYDGCPLAPTLPATTPVPAPSAITPAAPTISSQAPASTRTPATTVTAHQRRLKRCNKIANHRRRRACLLRIG
jgi:uncharacterized protein YkwD